MTSPIRSAIAAVVISSVMNTAGACSCVPNWGPVFLHVAKDSSIVLPANARGVLLDAKPLLAMSHGRYVLSAAPAPIDVRDFTIIEKGSGKRLPAALTRINVDMQMHPAGGEKYYLGEPAKVARLPHFPYGELDALAPKLGLPDISSEVRKGMGIFRVGPTTGFELGKTYVISYPYKHVTMQSRTLSVEVRIGPPIALNRDDVFALRLDGPPLRQNLTSATGVSCSMELPAIVQQISYAIPQAYRPYGNLISFYTFQHKSDGHAMGPATAFVATNYRLSTCDRIPAGASALGPLKDLTFAECRDTPPPARPVKGYVGMLELEDTLHATATVDIPFASAAGPACSTLRPK